ncbi:MAG: hypothetical protein ACJAZN_001489 [Planctomycetota bacterium]|jgi:hypothetical protein
MNLSMNLRSLPLRPLLLRSTLALSALLLPGIGTLPMVQAMAASPLGERGDEVKSASPADVATLTAAFLADAKAGTTYECNGECSEEGAEPSVCPAASSPRARLTSLVAKSPEAAAVFAPLAIAAAKAKGSDAETGALIGLLLESASPGTLHVAEAVYEVSPAAFSSRSLLGFCELGSEDLQRPLLRKVSKGDAGALEAAYLASNGESAGKKLLKRAWKVKDITPENALDVLVAGHALELLGQRAAEGRARLRVGDAAIAALDAGEIETARSLAVTLWTQVGSTGRSQGAYSLLRKRCAENLAGTAKGEWMVSANEIFEQVERLMPRG